MEYMPFLLIALFAVTVAFYLIRRRNRGTDGVVIRETPYIPDHGPEKDGDVNNGVRLTSFSSSLHRPIRIKNSQSVRLDGSVLATMQHGDQINTLVLGDIIQLSKSESLPMPLKEYTYKATIIGDTLDSSAPLSGDLGNLPSWRLIGEQSNKRTKRTEIYLEITAPEGYKSGVVVIELVVERGM